jgi:stage II sporulation protein D
MSRVLTLFLLLLILVLIALPALLARGCRTPSIQHPPAVDRSPIESPAGPVQINVYLHQSGIVEKMDLEEYLVGVVAAEMPASFAPEALNAQAVVARTYTVNQMLSYGGKGCSNHAGADICTDYRHCQAWESAETSLAKWSATEAAAYYNKLRSAVRQTAGMVIRHDGKLIDAVFHAHCGGHTENSENVWVSALPYLRGVPCPYCSGSRWSHTEHTFTGAEFSQRMLPYVSVVPVTSAGLPLLGTAVRTGTGRIHQVSIAGETLSGRDLRSALGLPSTHVTWTVQGNSVTFEARGYGHGVGLCQYGADGMAAQGKSYSEIINHYYTGVQVEPLLP